MNNPGKQIQFSENAIEKVKKGVDKLANAVKVTLGPKGRNVAVGNTFGATPLITKDGVTVAREISLPDPLENVGAQLVKEVAQKTADVAGDGTTTATVLAQAIFQEGLKAIGNGANPTFVKKGIDIATNIATKAIRKLSKVVDSTDLLSVATISTNNDKELGKLIADAMNNAGKDGVITVEESKTFETYSLGVDGMEVSRGYISPYFINDFSSMTCILENCKVLVTDTDINHHTQIVPILEQIVQKNQSILIMAGNVDGNALSLLLVNRTKGMIRACAVKAPYFGDNRIEALEDIAAVTGARFLSEKLGVRIEQTIYGDLGTVDRVIISKESCTFIGGKGSKEDIEKRIAITKQTIEKSNSDFDKEKSQERLARLVGGVIVLYIGAATETEMKEKKARVEDALHATRAAAEEGIVPGGGVTYIYAMDALDNTKIDGANAEDIKTGIKIVKDALKAPLFQICKNAGLTPEVILDKIKAGANTSYGYDVVEDKYGDMIKLGVIDPTKVTVTALANASSVAGMLLTLEAVIVDEVNEQQDTNRQPAIPGYQGM